MKPRLGEQIVEEGRCWARDPKHGRGKWSRYTKRETSKLRRLHERWALLRDEEPVEKRRYSGWVD